MIKENQSAPAATTNIPQINKHTQPSGMHDDQHTTVIPITPSEQTQSPADETPQTKTQEPQPTIAINSQDQNSIKRDMSSERNLMNDATFKLIQQKTPKRPKPCRVAIQILQQDTKKDKIKYFMRWEDPNAQKS